MNGKPRITPIEQQTSVRLGRDQVQRKINSPMTDTMEGIADLAGIMGQAMKERADAKAKYEKQLVLNWEEQLKNKYKELGGKLDQSQDPEEYDDIAAAALKDMKAVGKVFLGDKLYKRWENEEGTNYYNSVGIDVENKKQGLYRKQAYALSKDTVKRLAYDFGYAQTPEEKASALGAFEALIKDNNLSPIEVLSLTENFNRESEIAVLDKTLYSNPEEIATMDKDGKVTSIVDDPKKFNHLTIGEKRAYAERALTAQKARKKGEDEKMQPLYQWALTMSQNNPDELQKHLLIYRQNPVDFKKYIEEMLGYPVEAKKLGEMVNWTQSNLLDSPLTKMGVQKRLNFGEAEKLYKGFTIVTENGKRKIKNSDMNNVESLYEAVTTLRDNIKVASYTKQDGETVDKYANELSGFMGEKIMEADYAHNWLWDAKGDHMLQNEIAMFAKHAELSAEAVSKIYIKARGLALLHGVDLNKEYEGENATQIEKVFSDARKLYYHSEYGVPYEYADAYLYDNKLVSLHDQKESERADFIKKTKSKAEEYKAATVKGKKARVKKDKDGRITQVVFD